MAEPPKFSFTSTAGGTSSSSTAPSLFGTTNAPPAGSSPFSLGGNNPQGSNIFGGSNTNQTTSSSPFTLGGNKPAGGLFGSANTQTTPTNTGSNIFGSTSTPAGQPKPSLFGGGSNVGPFGQPPSGGPLFGGGSGSTPAAGSGTGFSFGQKPANSASGTTGQSSAGGLFTAKTTGVSTTPAQTSTTNIFGAPAGASTPASDAPKFSLGSTTPAGPPPATGAGTTSSLFGTQNAQPSGQQTGTAAPATSGTSTTPNLFGNAGTSTTSTSLFGGNQPATQSSGNLFGSLSTPQAGGFAAAPGQATSTASSAPASNTAAPATTGQQAGTSSASAFSFPSTANQSTGTKLSLFSGLGQPSSAPTTSTTPSSSFPTNTASTTQNSAPQTSTATAAHTTNLFGGLGSATQNAPAASSAGSSTNIFAGLGPPQTSQAAASIPASSSAAPTTTAAPPTSSLFSGLGAQSSAAPTTTSAPASAPAGGLFADLGSASTSTTSTAPTSAAAPASTSAASAPTTNAPASNLGSSTLGPAPPPQSRLKNKSMDEIITRWASDLSKYQKEFQKQAEQVAAWDRMLVENSDKISKLYSRTFQAERDTAEVERQLTNVEGQQEELSQWLDRYEREVDEMVERIGGPGDAGLQGPDQERERTYKLAEKLSDRLNGLNKDLSDVIEEINGVSAMLSKTRNADDPLSQVVRVLNSHLQQLQVIDTGAAALQAKVAAAQKEGQRIGTNGYHGLGSDPADDFYRSFMSRR